MKWDRALFILKLIDHIEMPTSGISDLSPGWNPLTPDEYHRQIMDMRLETLQLAVEAGTIEPEDLTSYEEWCSGEADDDTCEAFDQAIHHLMVERHPDLFNASIFIEEQIAEQLAENPETTVIRIDAEKYEQEQRRTSNEN